MPANICERVVFTDKAYLAIVAETYEKIGTETGGILLGKQVGSVWCVMEALDPGPNSIFRPAYFEYDTPYVTHLANKTARLYKHGIELLGLWHRHPGSFDAFSSTDNDTNTKYASQRESGAISGLVNLDPHFRLTMYHVALPLRYTKVSVQVGDELIPQDIFAVKSLTDFLPKKNRVGRHQIYSSQNHPVKEKLALTTRSEANLASARNEGSPQQAAGERTPKTLKPQSEASCGESDPQRFKEAALDLLEYELSYVESQEDYDYAITLNGNEVVLSMTYARHIPHYPEKLQFVFGVSAQSDPYVRINGREYGYKPNIVRDSINQVIANALVRRH